MLKCVLCKLSDIHVDEFVVFFSKCSPPFPLHISCFVIKIYKKTQEKLLRLTMWPIYFLLYRFWYNVVFLILEIVTQTRGRQNLKCYDTKTGKVTKIIQLSTSDKKYLVETFVVWNIYYAPHPPPPTKKDKTLGIFLKCNKSWILKRKFKCVIFLSQWKQFIKLFYGMCCKYASTS